jgi:acyl-homoserine lactone acylase PvdQ
MAFCKNLLISAVVVVLTLIATLYFIAFQDLLGGRNYLKRATRAFEKVDIHIQKEHGLKYVRAETYEGAVYGLGVIHARDRLWHMHFFRTIGKGRLSEVKDSFIIIFIRLLGMTL